MFLRSALYDARRCIPHAPSALGPLWTCRAMSRTVGVVTNIPRALPAIRSYSSRSTHSTVSSARKELRDRFKEAKFDALMWKFQMGLTEGNHQAMRAAYSRFLSEERQAKSGRVSYKPRPRQQEVLLATVDFLADIGQLDLLDIILDFMHARCGMPISLKTHESIIQRLEDAGQLRLAFSWLTQMRHKPGNIAPTVEMWNSFIRKCRWNKVPVEFFRKPVACVRMSGCEPNEETYQVILEALFVEQLFVPPMEDVKGVLEEMEKAGLLTRAVIDGLVHAYSRAKIYDAVSQLESFQRKLDVDFVPQDTRINTMLAEQLFAGSEREAARLLKDFIKKGFKPNEATLAVLSQGINTVRSLVYWESMLSIRANVEVWETVIQNASQNDNNTALELYRTALARGQHPTPSMLLPILRNFCSAKWGSSSSADIDKALQLLRKYVDITTQNDQSQELEPSPSSPGPQPPSNNAESQTSPVESSQHDLPLYNTVLRALTSTKNNIEYLTVATNLLEELQARAITMDSFTRTSFIILAMKCAPTVEDAGKVYNMMKDTKAGQPGLNGKGYTSILGAFAKNFSKSYETFPLCMNILKDMRRAGYHITVEAFTILLRQLAILAGRLTPLDIEGHESVIAAIRRVHNHIAVEASLKPDTVLWNQLMDSYQRAGCFRDAYKVWEAMYVAREFDYASVSIVWDACSHAGAYDMAKDIFLKLQKMGFVFNERNWSNWIECLCRLGRIDDATKVICIQMPQESSIKPTSKHAKIVLRFAVARNEESLVLARLKHYLPDIHAELT